MWGFRGFCLGSRLFLGPWGPFFLGGGKTGGAVAPEGQRGGRKGKSGREKTGGRRGGRRGRGRARGTAGGEEGKDGRGGERKGKPPAILGIAGGFCCLWG